MGGPFAGISWARLRRLVQATSPCTVVRQSERAYLMVNGPPTMPGTVVWTNSMKPAGSNQTESSRMAAVGVRPRRMRTVSLAPTPESNQVVTARRIGCHRDELRINACSSSRMNLTALWKKMSRFCSSVRKLADSMPSIAIPIASGHII